MQLAAKIKNYTPLQILLTTTDTQSLHHVVSCLNVSDWKMVISALGTLIANLHGYNIPIFNIFWCIWTLCPG